MSLLHKTKQQKRNNDPLIRLMTPMIAGILACVFCLVSMTWAWFTASVNTPTQTIQVASRSTSVKVYEISQPEEKDGDVSKTLVKPKTSEALSLAEGAETDDENVIISGEPVVWELSPEKSYEVIMTGSGTASTGYCEVALSHTASTSDEAETKLYTTSAFEKDNEFKFVYNTGGFSNAEGVTETQYKEYVEKTTPPTIAITSYWGKPAEDEEEQVSVMSLRDTSNEIMLLSDGDVLGLAPIPCPEAKAETEVELEGFEIQEGAEISAEEDYKVSLTLKEGYEMPSEVVVNIDGKDYVVSTENSEASEDAPYYDAETGVLTVPSALLSDGIKVSVKATATPIPEEEPAEEETEEEPTEETTDENETEEDKTADTPSDNNVVADNPSKKEEDGEQGSNEPEKTPSGDGGNDDDDNKADRPSSGGSSTGTSSSSGKNEDKTEDEKADVKLNLSQLTINLEETQIPTNADLVLTLSAKEDMELPERIVITLDKTIRDEDVENEENEEIIEDKTEYIINTDGEDNPEGFEFDAETGELTISSELLEGVREIAIADIEQNEADEDEEKATLTFEVKNLTFDFTDDEIVTDEDVVITFTAGEGYELPETIIITIDGEEYIIYTSEEDSDKNPEGITFDTETGTLTISKELLEDAEAITIAAEGVKKEDEESEDKEENTDTDKKDESEDKDNTGKENESESGDATDKKPEGGTDTPDAEDKTEPESGTNDSNGANTGTTTPETNPDNTTDDNGKDVIKGEDEDTTETPEPGTEPTTPTTPGTEDNADTEQGGEKVETEGNGAGSNENGTEETIPDTEGSDDEETTIPTEPTTPAEPSEPAVSPETPKTETPSTSEPTTGGNDDDNGETESADSSSTESSSNSGNDSPESDASSESTTSTTPSVTPPAPTTPAPATNETNTSSASTQASSNSSNAPASSAPAPNADSNSNGASQASGTTAPSGSKETSSEE